MKRTSSRWGALVSLVILSTIAMTTVATRKQGALAYHMAVSPNALGEQRQLVMLFNFQDQSGNRPWSRDTVNNIVFTQTKQYWESVSYNQILLTGDLVGWYTAAINTNDCSGNFRDAAENGARALGFEPNNYTHKIYIYPYRPCGGAQGGITMLSTDSLGNSQSWIYMNGAADFYSIAHEVGHSFGFRHSNSLNCFGVSLGSNCSNVEYGDKYDIMGYWNTGVANSYQRDLAGWLGPRIQTVTGDGTFVLTPTGNIDENLKAIRIPRGSQSYYYIEYRRPVGYDSFLSSYPLVTNGVLIRIGSFDPANLGFGSQLLDMTPSTSGRDEALPVGASYVDPAILMTITLLDANSVGATLNVQFAAQPSPTATPTPTPTPTATPSATPSPTPASLSVSVSTDRQTYSVNQTVATKAVVLSGGSAVASATVAFTITKSNGSVVRMNGTTGSDGSAIVKYRLGKKDPSGTYQDEAAATLSGVSGSKATSFNVGAAIPLKAQATAEPASAFRWVLVPTVTNPGKSAKSHRRRAIRPRNQGALSGSQ